MFLFVYLRTMDVMFYCPPPSLWGEKNHSSALGGVDMKNKNDLLDGAISITGYQKFYFSSKIINSKLDLIIMPKSLSITHENLVCLVTLHLQENYNKIDKR